MLPSYFLSLISSILLSRHRIYTVYTFFYCFSLSLSTSAPPSPSLPISLSWYPWSLVELWTRDGERQLEQQKQHLNLIIHHLSQYIFFLLFPQRYIRIQSRESKLTRENPTDSFFSFREIIIKSFSWLTLLDKMFTPLSSFLRSVLQFHSYCFAIGK